MGEILLTWLTKRLGVQMDIDPLYFGSYAADGTLIAKVLHSYAIITEEQANFIEPSSKLSNRLRNLRRLQTWLQYIGVEVDESMINRIATEKGAESVRLFYELYLCFENKETYGSHRTPLKETIVPETTVVESKEPISSSSISFMNKYNFIDGYKEKHQSLIGHIKAARKKFAHFSGKRHISGDLSPKNISGETKQLEIDDVKYMSCNNKNYLEDLTYADLMKLQAHVESFQMKHDVDQKDTMNYLSYLRMRSRKMLARNAFKSEMQKIILTDLWNNLEGKKQKEFNLKISEQLLKQSEHEKQTVTKLNTIQHEKKVSIETKRRKNKLFQKTKVEDHAFSDKQDITSEDKVDVQKFDEKTLDLHKRLYKERMQMKRDMKLNTCKDTVSDLIDVAVLVADFNEEHNTKIIPDQIWEDWKSKWLASVPLFDQTKDVTEEIQNPIKYEIVVELSENFECLTDVEFNLYLNLLDSWGNSLCETGENEEAENLTLLGFIIHRLLNLKHPHEPTPIPPELPPFTHAVALVGLDNERAISVIEELLRFQDIHILRLNDITNFFIKAFQEETGETENTRNNLNDKNDVSKDNLDRKSSKKKSKDKKTKLKSTKKKTNSDNARVNEENLIEPLHQDKAIQTPMNIPEDDILSVRAKLGKEAFDALSLGEEIDDDSFIEMFVEYLKENTAMKGWVLLNYPLTYRQASILEEKLIGAQLPLIPENLQTFEFLQQYFSTIVEERTNEYLNNLAESILLPNPIPKLKFDLPKSYLTKYLAVSEKQIDPILPDEHGEESIDNISNKLISPLEAFYRNQGIYCSFYHNVLEFPTIKQIARIIIENMEISSPSSDLFGENLKDIEIKFNATEKKVKSSNNKKTRSKETKSSGIEEKQVVTSKNKGRHKKSEEILRAENKNAKRVTEKRSNKKEKEETEIKIEKFELSSPGSLLEEDSSEIIEVQDLSDSPTESYQPESIKTQTDFELKEETSSEPPKPGEDGWQYIYLDIPEHFAIRLATLWENAEDIYITDWKRIFKEKAMLQLHFKPYMSYVKGTVMNIINKPDNKQDLIVDFQKMYKELLEGSTNGINIKQKLHCEVSELQSKLWDICDERKNNAETERRRVISENRIVEEIVALINSWLGMVQLETDRCVDTLQIVHNYYKSMLKNLQHIGVTFIEKIKVPRVLLYATDIIKRSPNESIEGFCGKCSSSENITLGVEGIESIAQIFTSCNKIKTFSTIFNDIILQIIKKVSEHLTQLKHLSEEHARKEEELLNWKLIYIGKKKVKKDTIREHDDDLEQLQAIKDVNPQLFEEWLEAINSETRRALLRIQLIHDKIIADVDSIMQDAISEFSHLHNEISENYNNEIKCINVLCNFLCKVIEEERPIQEELVLEKYRFYIRPDIIIFPPAPEIPSRQIEEKSTDEEFRICQLGGLMEKLKVIAPTGMLSQRALIYVLEDIITYEPIGLSLPKIWYELRSDEVSKIVRKMYGFGEYVDWKDFLIYGLNFKFPTIEELLDLREQFKALDPESSEVVSLDTYHRIRFNYNNDYDSDDPQLRLRANLGLELLFSMLQIAEDKVNYSALLLYFCKDVDPKIGLAKAIALCTGKKVFTAYSEYLVYNVLEEIIIKQMKESGKLAQAIGKDFLSDIINSVIQQSEGKKVTELSNTVNEIIEQKLPGDQNDEQMRKESKDSENISEKYQANKIREPNLNGELSSSTSNNFLLETHSTSSNESQLSQKMKEIEFSSTEYVFRISFEFILLLLGVCLPWHIQCSEFMDGQSLLQVLAQIFNDLCYNETTIYIHEFLEHPYTKKLLSKVNKFQSCNIAEEIKHIIINRNTIDLHQNDT